MQIIPTTVIKDPDREMYSQSTEQMQKIIDSTKIRKTRVRFARL
jgi:hypothetical protein